MSYGTTSALAEKHCNKLLCHVAATVIDHVQLLFTARNIILSRYTMFHINVQQLFDLHPKYDNLCRWCDVKTFLSLVVRL